MRLFLDLETVSDVDLSRRGLDAYVSDPSTKIVLVGYAIDNEAATTTTDLALVQRLVDEADTVIAHNAAFEWCVWNRLAGRLPLDKLDCTMARARYAGLPGGLDKLAHWLLPGLGKLTMPKRFLDGGAPTEELRQYCAMDVELARALHVKLPELPPTERQIWRVDAQINARGFVVDLPRLMQLQDAWAKEKEAANARLAELTGGEITSVHQSQRLQQYLGVTSLRGAVQGRDPEVAALRQKFAKNSMAKIGRILEMVGPDGRLRHSFRYYGAATGRWTGAGAQPQNLPRVSDDPFTRELRGCIIPSPGNKLLVADYKQIEARVTAWLAGEKWKLDAFRSGRDLYIELASRMFGVPPDKVTPEQRRQGKVVELACGYGGGYQAVVAGSGGTISPEQAQKLVDLWRRANARVVRLWSALSNQALVGRPPFAREGEWLTFRLPSGRKLYYFRPEVSGGALFAYKPKNSLRKEFNGMLLTRLRGSLLLENAAQALCRDLLASAILVLEGAGLPVVSHVHDEVVVDAPAEAEPTFRELLKCVPAWANNIPIDSDVSVLDRYE